MTCSPRRPISTLANIILATIVSLSIASVAVAADDAVAADGDENSPSKNKTNVLIVTVDDMSADSIGAFGCALPESTPNIDAFAKTALRFKHAHVQVGNCMPGRNIMWSGLFSHVNGVEGFRQNPSPDYPVLCDLAKSAGYFAAIRGKVSHSTPYHPYAWDADVTKKPDGGQHHVKDPASYGESTKHAIELANDAGKPFCLMVNISDPHKPFYNQGKKGAKVTNDPYVPSKIFSADEVPVPGFLPDDEIIRGELASYYSTVRRADDCFGHVISALEESGKADETFVIFFSDHGMPLPFAKTQLYYHSTRTPLMVRWPGVTAAGKSDDQHMVSAVDLLPTLLDVMHCDHPEENRLHGRSFVPLLSGQSQLDRDHVILQYNENSGRNRHPMRGIHTREFLYLYNPWSNGERKFATATTGTASYRQLVKRSENEPEIAARLKLFDHRVLEELYDVQKDPNCLVNLIDSEKHAKVVADLRESLVAELSQMNDPVAPVLKAIDDDSVRVAFMEAEDAKKAKNAKRKKTENAAKNEASGNATRLRNAIRFANLADVKNLRPGATVKVEIAHKIPKRLGTQALHVTLKRCFVDSTKESKRIERKTVEIMGSGSKSLEFTIPNDFLTSDAERTAVCFAAFIGKDYQNHLQHIASKPTKVGEN